jgi:hypothetical protein
MKLKHSVARWWVMAGVILLGACAQPPVNLSITVPVTPTVMAGTEWIAFSIDGVDEVLAPKPQLRWVQPERVTGTGGCNAFRGLAVSAAFALAPWLLQALRVCLCLVAKKISFLRHLSKPAMRTWCKISWY